MSSAQTALQQLHEPFRDVTHYAFTEAFLTFSCFGDLIQQTDLKSRGEADGEPDDNAAARRVVAMMLL